MLRPCCAVLRLLIRLGITNAAFALCDDGWSSARHTSSLCSFARPQCPQALMGVDGPAALVYVPIIG